MAKILTGAEICEIALRIAREKILADDEQYGEFITDMARVLVKHCGGKITGPAALEWLDEKSLYDVLIGIVRDENLPENGGVFQNYDPDGDLE